MELAYWRTLSTQKLIEAALVPPSIDFNDKHEWTRDLPQLCAALGERLRDTRDEAAEAHDEIATREAAAGHEIAVMEDTIYNLRRQLDDFRNL